MPGGLKKVARELLTSLPVVSHLFYKWYRYRSGMNDKVLRSHIQHCGHTIDLRCGNNESLPVATVREMEFLLREAGRRNLAIDEPLRWAIEQFARARYGLRIEPMESAGESGGLGGGSADQAVLARVIRERRSVRNWTAEGVDFNDIRDSIDVAKWAPSSCNRQLWHVLLIQREEEKEAISGYFPNVFYVKAPLLALVLMETSGYGQSDRHFVYLDGGAFIQNLLLILHAKGYGACWLGFKGWDCMGNVHFPAEKRDAFYAHFGLTPNLVPISMIAVGKPAKVPQAPPRQGLDQIVLRDKA